MTPRANREMAEDSPATRRRGLQLLRFLLVGTLGFVVDASVLLALVHLAGMSNIAARVPSFFVAVTVTWWCNRHFTFAVRHPPSLHEWTRFVVVNGIGNGSNLALYWTLVVFAGWSALAAVALASIVAAGINYTMSARWAF